MAELVWFQYALLALAFAWSGFVRSGLGFGGSVLTLPFLLLIHNDPLVYLPIISVHLLFFASLTLWQDHRKQLNLRQQNSIDTSVDWRYLKKALAIMIVPKLIGVFGLITLPATILSSIIFIIISCYSLSYIFNKPFRSNSKTLDIFFLVLGAYISGTSLIGAPLLIVVFVSHVAKERLRNTLFALWFILVTIKMLAFIWAKVDLQLIHHLWLLPAAAMGHWLGLHFHQRMLNAEPTQFFRVIGIALLSISLIGLGRLLL